MSEKLKDRDGVTVGTWLTREEHERLKLAAAKQDRSVSSYLRIAARDKMDMEEARNG